jgi:hypothetical protein
MVVVKIIYDGFEMPFDSLESGALQAAIIARTTAYSTVRLRVRTDLADELAAMLDNKLLNHQL